MTDTYQQAQAVADRLLGQGVRPTQQLVRDELGHGSITTIHKALNDWWAGLGARLEHQARLPELPEAIGVAMQGLWEQAVMAAERSAEKQLLSMQAQVKRSHEALQQAEQRFNDDRSQLLTRLDQLAQLLATQQQRNDELRNENVALQRRTLDAERHGTELQRDNQALQGVVTRLQAELEQLNERGSAAVLAALELENSNLRKVIEQQDRKLDQIARSPSAN
ncbi:MAG TPA: DNA-binding protein [Motiliproteus sp.]